MDFDELEREFYDDLNGNIVSVSEANDGVSIVFKCDDWKDNSASLLFTITCSQVVESTAKPSPTGLIKRTNDHPLLWHHNEAWADVYFSSIPKNEFEVLGHLYTTHSQLFKSWRNPSTYIHATDEFLRAGNGLLAKGPIKAIEAYQNAVTQFTRCSIISAYTQAGGYILLLFDECYVICRSVSLFESTGNA